MLVDSKFIVTHRLLVQRQSKGIKISFLLFQIRIDKCIHGDDVLCIKLNLSGFLIYPICIDVVNIGRNPKQ